MWIIRSASCLTLLLTVLTFANGQFSLGKEFDNIVELEPDEVLKKWETMEMRAKETIDGIVKYILPRAMEMSATLNISNACTRDSIKVITSLKKLKTWAVKFFDASSKSIDGVLGLNIASLGDYDECVNNMVFEERSGKRKGELLFQGKYCVLHIKPYIPKVEMFRHATKSLELLSNFSSKLTAIGEAAKIAHLTKALSLSTALCVPSSCGLSDLNQVIEQVSDYMGMAFKIFRCEVKQDTYDFTPEAIAVLCLYGFTFALVVFSTIVEMYTHYSGKELKDPGMRVLTTFSIIRNFKKLFTMKTDDENFKCLNGLKAICVWWIILGHTYTLITMKVHKAAEIVDIAISFPFQVITNMTTAVDTFFTITGVLVCHAFTKHIILDKKPFHKLMYVLNRLCRIWPSYAYVLGFIFLVPLLGSGPMFNDPALSRQQIEACKNNWWATLLFINNFVDTRRMCVPHGWYLSLDIQYHIAALLFLVALMKKPKLAISGLICIIILSMIGSACSIYFNNLPAALTFTPNPDGVMLMITEYYILPHAHIGPYSVGLLAGYFIATRKSKLILPRSVQLLGWIASTVTCLSIILGAHKFTAGLETNIFEYVIYAAFYRVAWSIAIAWIIISCYTGNGGVVNYFLSCGMWIPLARLALLSYLIHPYVMILNMGTTRVELRLDHRTAINYFFAHLILTLLASFVVSIMMQGPFLTLQKMLFTPRAKPDSVDKSTMKAYNGDTIKPIDFDHVLTLEEKPTVFINGIDNKAYTCKL